MFKCAMTEMEAHMIKAHAQQQQQQHTPQQQHD